MNASADREARAFVDRYWREFLRLDPLFATQLGVHDFDDRLADMSESGRAAAATVHRSALLEARAFAQAELSFETRAAVMTAEELARRELSVLEQRLDRLWSVSYEQSGHWLGPPVLLAQIVAIQPLDDVPACERLLGRLGCVPAYLRAQTRTAAEAAASGELPPEVVVERTRGQVERLLAVPVGESALVQRVASVDPAIAGRVAVCLSDRVYPAFQSYLDCLVSSKTRTQEPYGLCGSPDGEAVYDAEIRNWTTLPFEPRVLHEIGCEDLARIDEERSRVARALGYRDPVSATAAVAAAGEHGERERVVRFVEERLARALELLPHFFNWQPGIECRVAAIDPIQEDDFSEYYVSPSGDGLRPGTYFVTTKRRLLSSLVSTIHHETVPGHHLQFCADIEARDRADLRRFATELAGLPLAEGWAVYAEQLADEMGLYVTDEERLGMLNLQALRAARLVVDTGLHAFGWTRERAIRLLAGTGRNGDEARLEVDRYLAMPGQALCYRVGQREVERLRDATERVARAHNPTWLRDFHSRLLAVGSLPLAAVRSQLAAIVSP